LALALPPLAVRGLVGASLPRADGLLAAIVAMMTYLYLAPVLAGALTHIYRQSAVIQDA
jgi:hypothetical protein